MNRKSDRIAVGDAIALFVDRNNVPPNEAWAAIVEQIGTGQLHAEGIGERGEPVAIPPHWTRWIARFGEPPSLGTPESGGIVWFDTERAVAEWRARREDHLRRDVEPSRWVLPPHRLRDLTLHAGGVALFAEGSSDEPSEGAEQPAEPQTPAPRPRTTRRNEKRPEIIEAVKQLAGTAGWQEVPDKTRCRLVEQNRGKPAGWCTPRSLRRAIESAADRHMGTLATCHLPT